MNSKRLLSSLISFSKFSSNSEADTFKIRDILRQARVFTNADVVEYSKVSYDSNPLHFDTQCAQNAGFPDRIVHGMLVASLFPRIISSHFVSFSWNSLCFTFDPLCVLSSMWMGFCVSLLR